RQTDTLSLNEIDLKGKNLSFLCIQRKERFFVLRGRANTPHLPSPLFKKEGRGIKEKVCLYMLSIAEKICVVVNKIKPLEYFFFFLKKYSKGFSIVMLRCFCSASLPI
ncbi:MAG: hypothetical protein II972_01110, partial [Elusimicrobiaceae bacterium]|nr:hypothetical protein [Elusimicrobiaceae bacterium]